MQLIDKMRNYLLPENLEIYLAQDCVHIVNFTSIGEISTEKIIVRHQNGRIQIKGSNLVLGKLVGDEVLIRGNVEQIEFR